MKSFDPSTLGPRDRYRLLNSFVTPRPIALVSTVSVAGIPNLAPFSYFMAGGANPPSLAISPVGASDGGRKDTLRNIEETGEWTISLVTFAMTDGANAASAVFSPNESEWPVSGFTSSPSEIVTPSFVAESPFSVECRLFQIVRHGPGALSANYCIGEIVRFHVASSILDANEEIDPTRLDAVARMSGDWYARAVPSTMFELARPE